jgi:hypothetical protein
MVPSGKMSNGQEGAYIHDAIKVDKSTKLVIGKMQKHGTDQLYRHSIVNMSDFEREIE